MPKSCTLCNTPRPVLVRCQIDSTAKWHFVCPGKCWQSVSGGMEDAKGFKGRFPDYRYGGMWKDRSADGPVSAKKPRKVKERQKTEEKARRERKGGAGGVQDGDGDGCGSGSSEEEKEKSEDGVVT